MIAYCWASGQIGFGRSCPVGALPIISGPARTLRAEIEVTARLAYDNKTLLVPGVPEAPDQKRGVDALLAYTKWLISLRAHRAKGRAA